MRDKQYNYEKLFQHYSELFVKKFNEAMVKSRYTQTAIAKLLKRSSNAVFKWTRGFNIPGYVVVQILCDIFEIDRRFFSQEDLSFEEARELRKANYCNMKGLNERLQQLEKKISDIPYEENEEDKN